nr:MAG TPA: hypothetical protein [Caudoviricetes sp.]
MNKKIKIMNKIYYILVYAFTFLTFLSLLFKLVSLTPIYTFFYSNTSLLSIVFIICIAISLILTHLLIRLLSNYQRNHLG